MQEDKIQQSIYLWFTNNYVIKDKRCMILSIPNGGLRDKRTAMVLKSTGLYAGAADLLVVFRGWVCFVEVKTETGTQSDVQRQFEAHCITAGIAYRLVRNLEQFQQLILSRDYANLPKS
jgi:hypothetical protein